jgi:hypothetical protein
MRSAEILHPVLPQARLKLPRVSRFLAQPQLLIR